MVDDVKAQRSEPMIPGSKSDDLVHNESSETRREAVNHIAAKAQKNVKDDMLQKMENSYNEQVTDFEELIKILSSGKMSRTEATLFLMARVDIALQFTNDYLKLRSLSTEDFEKKRSAILKHLKKCENTREDPFNIFTDIEELMDRLRTSVLTKLLENKSFVNTSQDIFFKYIINFQKILVKGLDFYQTCPVIAENTPTLKM